MNLTPEQQKQRDELLADMEKMRQRIESFCTPEPVKSEWPQNNDGYLTIGDYGDISRSIWVCHDVDYSRLAVGNVYRPEHRAYAERHVEALKVQAELRRMPGVCAYSDGSNMSGCYCIDWVGGFFKVSGFLKRQDHSMVAIAGVWFKSFIDAEQAIVKIGEDRLALFRDDYLQVPIVDGGA